MEKKAYFVQPTVEKILIIFNLHWKTTNLQI